MGGVSEGCWRRGGARAEEEETKGWVGGQEVEWVRTGRKRTALCGSRLARKENSARLEQVSENN